VAPDHGLRVPPPVPYYRETGAGPAVVCLHASASNSRQWQPLADQLAPRFRVLAADAYGSGQSPAWKAKRPLTLRDEVALLEPVFARAGGPVTLVAHSYGAAVALIAALERPERVHALALYEPTLFSLVNAESPPPNDVDGFRATFARAAALFDTGDPAGAGRCFVDYWAGEGAWAQMPEPRQGQVAVSMANLRGWYGACMAELTPLRAFSWLGAPVLLMTGRKSPPSSRAVARLLSYALPRVEVMEFDELGHMGPVTHPEPVNKAIGRFLERHRPFHHADLLQIGANLGGADSRDVSEDAARARG
jgi:pimeloyl-ACP methyl ester carboxylesterase